MSVSGASAKAAHVVLRPVLHFDEEDSQVRFDECARRLILIKHRQFAAFSTVPTLPPIVVDSNGKVENVRFSLNHRFAALQRSDTVIDFVDLQTNASFTHAVKGGGSRGRWRILSYHWTGTPVADFFVVTTAGVEFYLVLPEKGCLKLVKALALAVAWAVYSHATRLLLLATGAQDNVLHGVQIQPSALVRLPKFEVQLAPPAELPSSAQSLGQPKLRRSLLPNDIFVARLYESIYCIQVEAERQQLLLYQLFRDFVVRKFALAIYSSRAVMSVSDNLLVVHALDSKVCLIFDLRINQQYPITAPLPLGTVASDQFSPLYSPHWTFVAPDLVVDPQAGRVGQLRIDLHTIVRSSIDKACLLQFLLARTHCADVILDVFSKSIAEQEELPTLARMFDLVHAAYARQLLIRHAVVSAPALGSASPASKVLTEFLLSQQQHSLPTNAGIGTLALMLLGEQGSFYQMHQLVQFMLVPDSIELAMRLLSFEPKYPPAAELAIDMLQRLGPGAVETLMECLMRRGLLLAACRLLRSQRMVLYPARRLLQAAFESGDATLFAAVYTHFEQRNEVWRGSKAFAPEEGCAEYVAKFEEMFGPPATIAYGPLRMDRESARTQPLQSQSLLPSIAGPTASEDGEVAGVTTGDVTNPGTVTDGDVTNPGTVTDGADADREESNGQLAEGGWGLTEPNPSDSLDDDAMASSPDTAWSMPTAADLASASIAPSSPPAAPPSEAA
ncbi:hypothetical protein Ctob_010768 [Chrysochromulina tobinii]|uniref:Uncharacterized protein n=1 Tax=Chrysochromulina tobinii TaxID=1460289 RepID=A0A0M0LPT2_9EUKA|nr:hypothetical protein Ctob_010768 [Chrysochromulina tobinii]|eukprot:KOO52996.1 hypothetical protein Ctob_010768 [Chrysochromulina sp. CCMP291]